MLGSGLRAHAVYNPATGRQSRTVELAGPGEVRHAVVAALMAWPQWTEAPSSRRAKILNRLLRIIQDRIHDLATVITSEYGKLLSGSIGEIQRGMDVVEFAIGALHLLKGEVTEDVGANVDSIAIRQPLGVVAGIAPFDFPAMVPMWMFPVALACGDCFILEPSERDASASLRLAERLKEAGLPDADLDQAADALMGAGYGSAKVCHIVISIVVPIDDATADALIARLAPIARALKIGPGTDPDAEMGPLLTKQHLERVRGYVDAGSAEGATLVVDGRGFRVQFYEEGYFLGGTLVDNVAEDMKIYREEIFGPVLSVVRARTYDEAASLIDAHELGSGTSIFTRDGDAARAFAHRIQVGKVGIDVSIPIPMAFHSRGGWNASLFDDHYVHGPEGVRFDTSLTTITSRWPTGIRQGIEFAMPTMR
jgi:malonate-semialdehyde dehydrogenase (acetylating)/methylmalonate-semialdehyde dehydrogenase